MTTQLLQKKLEWQEHRGKDNWQGSEKRPTMYRQHGHQDGFRCGKTNTCYMLGEQATRGWITDSSSVAQNEELGRMGDFRNRGEQVQVHGMHSPRERRIKLAKQILWNVESKAGRRQRWVSILTRVTVRVTTCEVVWTRQLLGDVALKKNICSR